MYSRFQLVLKYLNYYLTASNGKGHGIHSPFIFEFITKVLNDRKIYPEYERVESLRSQLLKNHMTLEVEDFGAGSSTGKTNKRSISSIASSAAKTKKFGQLLFRIARYYQPSTILELGTSLGISASYLGLANSDAKLITLEGSKEIAEFAKSNFGKLELQNIESVVGNFNDTLSSVINGLSAIDLVFVDGNHRKEPTKQYFHQLLSKINNDSILIFDDIHWSSEMEEAWSFIHTHHSVTCSIDLFFFGIVFFRKEFKEKQHFLIRF